jgi:hypothetical protein
MKIDKTTAPLLHDSAQAAAVEAAAQAEAAATTWFPCGFAWVRIRPARGAFVNWCKANGVGEPSITGGYRIWNPSGHPTQSMEIKLAGAEAYAQMLRDHGINAYAESRMD